MSKKILKLSFTMIIAVIIVYSIGMAGSYDCDCYGNLGRVWDDCDDFCSMEESNCKSISNEGSFCLFDDCVVHWIFICYDGPSGGDFYFTPCAEDCEEPPE